MNYAEDKGPPGVEDYQQIPGCQKRKHPSSRRKGPPHSPPTLPWARNPSWQGPAASKMPMPET